MSDSVSEPSMRELEVLEMLSRGMSSREIAKELFISVNTVEFHRKQLLRKTNSRNVAHLIRNAYCSGLLLID